MARARIIAAVFDSYQGRPNVNCGVRIEDGEYEGQSVYGTLYLDRTPKTPGAPSSYDRSLETLLSAGCDKERLAKGDLTGFDTNDIDAVIGYNNSGKTVAKYMNPLAGSKYAPELTVKAKDPPSKRALAELFGRDPAPMERHGDADDSASGGSGGPDDGDIPF